MFYKSSFHKDKVVANSAIKQNRQYSAYEIRAPVLKEAVRMEEEGQRILKLKL